MLAITIADVQIEPAAVWSRAYRDWEQYRPQVGQLLANRSKDGYQAQLAAQIFAECGELGWYRRTEAMNPQTLLLKLAVPAARFDEIKKNQNYYRKATELIAAALRDAGLTIPLIGLLVTVVAETAPTVAIPSKARSVAEHALHEADELIKRGKYSEALDRSHTALHGYLRSVAHSYKADLHPQANLIASFQVIRKAAGWKVGQIEELEKIIDSAEALIRAVNDIRNRHSLAHPSQTVLGQAEAAFAVNIMRSLFGYVVHKEQEAKG